MTSFEDRLRGELVSAIERSHAPQPRRAPRQWSPRPLAVLAAAALAVGLVALPAVLRTDPALAIERSGHTATITLLDTRADVGKLNAELAAAGLGARVREEPASPSAVGSWLGLYAAGKARGIPQVGKTLTLDTGESGNVELLLGIAAENAPYVYSASAFRHGEALNCSGLGLSPATKAAADLRSRGLQTTWFVLGADGSITPAAGGAIPPGVVTGAEMQSSTSVRLYVSATGMPSTPPDQDNPAYVLDGDPRIPPPDHLVVDQGRFATTTEGSQCRT
ncbi:MAG: hypothetical protein V9G19_21905 [Tetrasphaera sp.]